MVNLFWHPEPFQGDNETPSLLIVKLQFFFPYTCLFTFLVTIITRVRNIYKGALHILWTLDYNIGEFTSATSKERMTTKYYFCGCHTHWLMKSSYASKLCICICSPVAQRYRQRRAWKVSLLATRWKYRKFTCDSALPGSISHSEKAKGQLR